MKSMFASLAIMMIGMLVCLALSQYSYPDDEMMAGILTNRLLLGVIVFMMAEKDFRRHN